MEYIYFEIKLKLKKNLYQIFEKVLIQNVE